MKIYIVGSGGVGGYLGGLLAKTSTNYVTFVARKDHFQAIKKNGLQINRVKGNFLIKPAQVISSLREIKNPDLILFTVKTYDTQEAAKQLNEIVNDKTIIITFQNGVENDLEIKKYVKKGLVFPGVAYLISTRIKPGVIEQIGGVGGIGRFIIGDRNNSTNEKLDRIVKIMREAEIDAVLSKNITQDIWKKFVLISAFSGITTLYKKRIGEIIKDNNLKTEYENCVRETIKVAKALKVDLPENIFEITMATTEKTNPASKSSLLVDVERGGRNEIETLNGTVIKYAKQFNINIPINNKIYSSIK
ncbi:MAG: 2-dehydropantoate 2-reductase [Candidatus Roizmanbacteria bacterium GW2011_GWC2_37_13]|uniref:2-dehydropantoate 2-reductase n=1 Tax=Candidatus Roizmanbacteria bacterium GW2011_GWC2_37_13 TaxID=1618486 RepID=A0A0G0G5C1_9BACT|nr:MAG: 2-dehydropantoate 2-reductase [Candidatus Roizmanbacteria bacterium GW2011_GWC1_37_12]KKQ25227.1 MAG: 2-dehydropantoate 2-reductase [Candidatus Roizmanbacteria bacterium GW2011_GWC2_37_13]